jgi:hypothetical protein
MGKKRESSRYERHVHDSMAAILCTTVLSRQDRLSPRRVDAVLCVRAVGSGWAETDGRGKHRTPDTGHRDRTRDAAAWEHLSALVSK